MNRYHLVHVTEFTYDGPVSESYNEVRLRPLHDERQSCLSFRISTTPHVNGTTYRDAYENSVYQFNLLQEHRQLTIEAESIVLTHEQPETAGQSPTLAELDSQQDDVREEYFDFLTPTEYVPHLHELREFIEAAEEASGGAAIAYVEKLSNLIHDRFRYLPGATSRSFIDCRFLEDQRRRLPGLRSSPVRRGAHARTSRSLRFGVSGSAGVRGSGK